MSHSKEYSPNLAITSSNNTSLTQTFLITDNQTQEIGARESLASVYPTNYYIYNGQFNMVMIPADITSLLNATASTSTSTGALILSDGIGVIKNSFFGGTLNVASTCYLGTTSKNICIGTSIDTTRLISALDSALTATSSTYGLCFGQANSTNNQIEHSFYYAGSGLSTNRYEIGFYGGNRLLTLQANGTLRINNPPTMSNGTGIV